MLVNELAYMIESDSIYGLKFHVNENGFLKEEFITRNELVKNYGKREVEKIHLEDSSTVMMIIR